VTASRPLPIFLALLLLAANYPEPDVDTATEPYCLRFSPGAYDRLKLDMSKEAVTAILGCAPIRAFGWIRGSNSLNRSS
jgi:hypothetical protein